MRLQPGENPTIDKINQCVADVQSGGENYGESLETLLTLFHPLILKLCKKWSIYFDDKNHRIKPFDDLVADTQEWFIKYTKDTYKQDGSATYNKFIKDHLDQRIRYIYECELKYRNSVIMPDPDRCGDDDSSPFEDVVYSYSSDVRMSPTFEELHAEYETAVGRDKLAKLILSLLYNEIISCRERDIYLQAEYYGRTHKEIAKDFNISRTRVTQILQKTRKKLYNICENNQDFWDLVNELDLEFPEQ